MVFLAREVPDLAGESGFYGRDLNGKNPKINNGGQQQQLLLLLLGGRGRGDYDDGGGVPRGLPAGR